MQEVEGLLQRDAALQREFLELVPPSNPFHPQLFKIFKRRIKRSKKVGLSGPLSRSSHVTYEDGTLIHLLVRLRVWALQKENDDGTVGEDEDEEEEDDEDFDDEDLDEDEEGQDDTCPLGCDTGLHLRVLQLRERRLDQEEVLQEFQKRCVCSSSMEEEKTTAGACHGLPGVRRQSAVERTSVCPVAGYWLH